MKSEKNLFSKLKGVFTEGTVVKILFTAFILVSAARLLKDGEGYSRLDYGQENGLLGFFIWWTVISVLLCACEYFFGKCRAVEWTMLAGSLVFALVLAAHCPQELINKIYAAIIIVFALIISYLSSHGLFEGVFSRMNEKTMWGIVIALSAAAGFTVAAIGTYRYLSYSTPNFDFGIWCQMFHNMCKSGLPVTTCERDGLLSHFAVHFSPIYYLMLPFYALFRSPMTLQILQAAVLYSGIFPLCIMAKSKGLTPRSIVLLGMAYAFYPAIATGTFYDLHENCFLLPLLLWCFCFFEKEKYLPMAIFALLTLLVKEDAFIYVLVFALYVFFLKGKKRTALLLALGAVVYFTAVSTLMKSFGNGIMVSRYDNLISNPDDGLFGVVKTALLNPGYLLTQLFVSKDGDASKIIYIFQLLMPVAFIPVATKKISRCILVVPMLMNIITMYVYQPNIRFQYSFGITAFLFYAAVLNLSEMSDKPKRIMLPLSAVASLLLFAMLVCGNYGYYRNKYVDNKEQYKIFDTALKDVIPADASVACTTFLVPHMAERDEIYEVKYHTEKGRYKTDVEYVAFDMRYASENVETIDFYKKNGYSECYLSDGLLLILKKK